MSVGRDVGYGWVGQMEEARLRHPGEGSCFLKEEKSIPRGDESLDAYRRSFSTFVLWLEDLSFHLNSYLSYIPTLEPVLWQA